MVECVTSTAAILRSCGVDTLCFDILYCRMAQMVFEYALVQATTLSGVEWNKTFNRSRLPQMQMKRIMDGDTTIYLSMGGMTGGLYPFHQCDHEKDSHDLPMHLFASKRFSCQVVARGVPAGSKTLNLHASYDGEAIVFEILTLGGNVACQMVVQKDDIIRAHQLKAVLLEKMSKRAPHEYSLYTKVNLLPSKSKTCAHDLSVIFKRHVRQEKLKRVRLHKKQPAGWWFTEAMCLPCSMETLEAAASETALYV